MIARRRLFRYSPIVAPRERTNTQADVAAAMSCGGIAAWMTSIGVEMASPNPNAARARRVSWTGYVTFGVRKA
jgi:hypothetical protein